MWVFQPGLWELYYLCSEIEGADQLHGYQEANLRLCFRLCRMLVFWCGGSFISYVCECMLIKAEQHVERNG